MSTYFSISKKFATDIPRLPQDSGYFTITHHRTGKIVAYAASNLDKGIHTELSKYSENRSPCKEFQELFNENNDCHVCYTEYFKINYSEVGDNHYMFLNFLNSIRDNLVNQQTKLSHFDSYVKDYKKSDKQYLQYINFYKALKELYEKDFRITQILEDSNSVYPAYPIYSARVLIIPNASGILQEEEFEKQIKLIANKFNFTNFGKTNKQDEWNYFSLGSDGIYSPNFYISYTDASSVLI